MIRDLTRSQRVSLQVWSVVVYQRFPVIKYPVINTQFSEVNKIRRTKPENFFVDKICRTKPENCFPKTL